MKPILELTGLRVERSRTTILRGVDWRVTPGEHWVAARLRLNRAGTRCRLEFPRP